MFIINILSENLIFMKKLYRHTKFPSKINLIPFKGICIAFFYFLFFRSAALGAAQDKVVAQSPIEAFSKADYEKALSGFSNLLASYPKDPVYKYYSGACLVKLERDPVKAETLLKEAVNGSAMKTVPEDVLFYLGRAQQMAGKFDEAEKTFKRFEREAGKRYARQLNTREYISQSRSGEGMVPATRAIDTFEAEKPVATEKVSSGSGNDPVYVTEAADKALTNIIEKQYEADLHQESGKDIEDITQKTLVPEPAPVSPVTSPVKTNANAGTVSEVLNAPTDKPEIKTTESKLPAKQQVNEIPENDRDQAEVGVYSIFSIEESTQAKDVRIDPTIPEGLVYRIQIAVFKNSVNTSFFKGLTPIEGFKSAGSGSTTYYAGIFRRSADARKSLSAVRNKGFKDSFVAAIMNGKTISSERAAVYEKEWGDKPLFVYETEQTGERLDTVPPTLHFRVEVARSLKPLAPAEVESLRRLAGNRGLDIVQLENGNMVYLIGSFITFESAEDYADLLQRNGYRDASVVAWLGKKEIDLETAKQLFNSL